MTWFWIGFFTFVALLLFLDLFVLHKTNKEESFRSAAAWTLAWITLGMSFTGVVYLMYENAWLGAKMIDPHTKAVQSGLDAAIVYVSAYLLEYALSVDNIFVISMLFNQFRVPPKFQHRVLFWGIMGAVVFRVAMIAGGAYLAKQFAWIFYVFGGYLVYAGIKMIAEAMKEEEDAESGADPLEKNRAIRVMRKFITIVRDDEHGRFTVKVKGKTALTTLAACLIVVELTDIVFALDSIPAVLAISQETFIMVTSNIFAILGLRSLYFVLQKMMAQFHYLKYAVAMLLVLIGVKMIAHDHFHIPHEVSLGLIAGIIAAGVIASVVSNRRKLARLAAAPPSAEHEGEAERRTS